MPGDGVEYLLQRHALADGDVTTVYAVRHPARSTKARVVHFEPPEHLDAWCVANRIGEAIVGGFFLRDPYRPLGELWIQGQPRPYEPVAPPYAGQRATVVVDGGGMQLLARDAAPARPAGDLLQVGPLLVAGGEVVFADDDREGFSAGAGQFDSDITDGDTRAPRSGSRTSG